MLGPNDYGKYIEELRKMRNLSRDELINDIISKRNYQRFVSGEVSIATDKLLGLIDRLELDFFAFYNFYFYNHKTQAKLSTAMNRILQYNITDAKSIIRSIDKNSLTDNAQLRQYRYIETLLTKTFNPIEPIEYYNKLKALINYPNILKKKLLNAEEISALLEINTYNSTLNDKTTLNYFLSLVEDDLYLYTSRYSTIISNVFDTITKSFYMYQEYDKVTEYALKGIEFSQRNHSNSGMANLFGYLTMAYHKMHKQDKAITYALKMFYQLEIEDNPEKSSQFLSIIKSATGIDVKQLITIEKET
jgi:transcriptional regulator with XRE-family HTH domain